MPPASTHATCLSTRAHPTCLRPCATGPRRKAVHPVALPGAVLQGQLSCCVCLLGGAWPLAPAVSVGASVAPACRAPGQGSRARCRPPPAEPARVQPPPCCPCHRPAARPCPPHLFCLLLPHCFLPRCCFPFPALRSSSSVHPPLPEAASCTPPCCCCCCTPNPGCKSSLSAPAACCERSCCHLLDKEGGGQRCWG